MGAAPSLLSTTSAGVHRRNEFTGEPILINERDRRYFTSAASRVSTPLSPRRSGSGAMYGYSSTSEIHKDQLEDHLRAPARPDAAMTAKPWREKGLLAAHRRPIWRRS